MNIRKKPSHPGEVLKREFIEHCNIEPYKLAKDLGWNYGKLEELLNGEINLTISSAMDLSKTLDLDPEFWIKIQEEWDEWKLVNP